MDAVAQMMPTTSEDRKNTPIVTGVLDYFPLAIAAVARLSKFGNDKHNPGQPLHWSREKSKDHADCIGRHLADRGVIDPESGMSHSVEVAWRALALLQVEEEQRLGLPISRGSRMRGSRPRVYLAGPITGCDYAGAVDWRDDVSNLLWPRVVGVSPMRGKTFLQDAGIIGGTPHEDYMKNVISRPAGIVCRDHYDVQTCDAVLMNLLGATRISVGTMIEVGWADAYRKPLILVMEPQGNLHEHAMLDRIAGYRVPTLEDAVIITKALFA